MIQYRFDLLFSYWIFAWFFLYELLVDFPSPKLALLFGIIENFLLLMVLIWKKIYLNDYSISSKYILFLFIINICIKAVPFILLRKVSIYWKKDISNFIFVFFIFIYWTVIINHKNPLGLFWNYTISPINTPGTAFLSDVWKEVKKISYK